MMNEVRAGIRTIDETLFSPEPLPTFSVRQFTYTDPSYAGANYPPQVLVVVYWICLALYLDGGSAEGWPTSYF